MARCATWQDHEPSEANSWNGWDGSSWHTEPEANAKTWQEGSGWQPNTAGNTTWQDAESEAPTWPDAWDRSATRAWPLQDEIRAPQNPSRLSADPETMASGATWQDH